MIGLSSRKLRGRMTFMDRTTPRQETAQSSETESQQGNKRSVALASTVKAGTLSCWAGAKPNSNTQPVKNPPRKPYMLDSYRCLSLTCASNVHMGDDVCLIRPFQKIRAQIANCLVLQGIKQSLLGRPSWCSARSVLDQRQHTTKDRRH